MASRSTQIVLLLLATRFTLLLSTPFPSITRSVVAVKLTGGHMEIVHEERCSDSTLRLTCRSLKAFIFVLEAEYQMDRTEYCGYDLKRVQDQSIRYKNGRSRYRSKTNRQLRGNYVDEDDEDLSNVDLRSSLNRRCSGHQHCRFNMATDHPGATTWSPANLILKYACIPEAAVRKYCNTQFWVPGGEGGYLKSPGYPLYYTGGNTCGWIFASFPGQKIVLTFHDLNIRSPETDGSCVDVVRIRENSNTLYEFCGTAAGIKVTSSSNIVTLDLIASTRLYPARGFLVQYQVLGCPDVSLPNGSYVINSTIDSRTVICQVGSTFPDTKNRTRILECKDGRWSEDSLPNCVATSAVILKAERENNHISNLSEDSLTSGVRIGRGDDAAAESTDFVMDSAQPAMMKEADYVVDVVLPTILIALLFVGNAVIIYIIFQYRKRKVPAFQGEDVALSAPSGVPQV
ncbi:uncharacterized protein LOC107275061 isoform X2 [Cephus cinctus]|uniref:Uncharacterized protein LOC107275061 isoform X2 n=1 Tax=Cephus cinctus TaxID=211228 RepID=A0AAJ7FVF5_CEPCN|nr:uncharacterized protein LOC107275061 isoform X2 [Cephus cinctus]